MSNLPIFDVAGSAMQAQSVRLSTVASNLANANTLAGTAEGAYRAKQPVFSAEPVQGDPALAGVQVTEVRESDAAPIRRYDPGNPLADPQGYVAGDGIPEPVQRWQDAVHRPGIYDLEVDSSVLTPEAVAARIQLRLATPPQAFATLATR